MNTTTTTQNAEEYFDWLSKFETKKTTDDCYTPPAVYNAVLEYVHEQVRNLDGLKIVRPFFPNGDYTDLSQYDENTIVIDNPPFSLISKISKFYQDNHIQFFLFAPAMTVLQCMRTTDGLTAIIAPHPITYANGAVVPTAFITNMLPTIKAKTALTLFQKLKVIETLIKPSFPKYSYPKNILMVNELQKFCRVGIEFEVLANESCYIRNIASQKTQGKTLFGGGLFISDAKAKELQVKELQAKKLQVEKDSIVWTLSDHEKQIIDKLNHA